MKNYVYVISTDGTDYISEMAAISILSLKLTNPLAKITVVLDQDTLRAECNGMAAVMKLADYHIVINVDYRDCLVRSRYMKASLRNIINGKFIYLDCDTIIMKNIDDMWLNDADLAAVSDMNVRLNRYVFTDAQRAAYAAMGWNIPLRGYFNGGVLYFNDSASSKKFGREFLDLWVTQYERIRKPNDQYAFNHLINIGEYNLRCLSYRYNAQVVSNPLAAFNASIIHVFSGNFESRDDTVLHFAAKKLKTYNEIDDHCLRNTIEKGNPWRSLDSLKKCISVRRYDLALKLMISRVLK